MTIRSKLHIAAALLAALALFADSAAAVQVGAWQFDGNLNNAVPGKAPMAVFGGWAETYTSATINGSPATVLSFPALTSSQALQMPNQAGANGGGSLTNAWSIVMDVNFPVLTGFASFWQTDQTISANDGDFFVRGNNDGIGIGGNYHGAIAQDTWNRVAVAVQPSGGSYLLDKYINGVLVGSTTSGTPLDGRHAVGAVLNLFTDEDGETAAGLVNSLAYYNTALSANDIGLLGGPTAAGVPAVPEPASAALAVGGLSLLGLLRRRLR